MIGLTGVGGGVMTVPVLILFMGVPAAPAVGTALAFSALVKVPAAFVYLRERRIDFPVLRRLLMGGLPGVLVGGLLLGKLEGGGLRNVVLVAVGVTIALTAVFNLVRLVRDSERRPPGRDRRRLLPKFVDIMLDENDLTKAVRLYGYQNMTAFESDYNRYRFRF